MTSQEKSLYHQIHPLKLLTDVGVTFPSLYLLWQHQLVPALVVTFVPPIITSALLIRYADLEPLKHSAFGRYIAHTMTPTVVAIRVLGLIVMSVGAWLNLVWSIPLGIAIAILAWMSGLFHR